MSTFRPSRPADDRDDAGADDLPDIVDVVMAKGTTAGDAAARGGGLAGEDDLDIGAGQAGNAGGQAAASPVAGATPFPPLPVVPEATASRLPGHLEDLAGRARAYVEAASSVNTRRAYAADWKHFAGWCRRQGFVLMPPDPRVVGLYITACASGAVVGDRKPNSVSTIERRLSSLSWNYAQRGGERLDRKDRHIATVLAGIRNRHAAPPRQKEAILPEDLVAMLETLDRGTLRGLRDRAMLLIGFAGGLRRSEIVGLDCGRDHTEDGRGWVEILDKGMLLHLQNRLARGRSRARLVRCHLPCRGVGDLARVCAYRTRAPVPAGQRPRQGGRRRSA